MIPILPGASASSYLIEPVEQPVSSKILILKEECKNADLTSPHYSLLISRILYGSGKLSRTVNKIINAATVEGQDNELVPPAVLKRMKSINNYFSNIAEIPMRHPWISFVNKEIFPILKLPLRKDEECCYRDIRQLALSLPEWLQANHSMVTHAHDAKAFLNSQPSCSRIRPISSSSALSQVPSTREAETTTSTSFERTFRQEATEDETPFGCDRKKFISTFITIPGFKTSSGAPLMFLEDEQCVTQTSAIHVSTQTETFDIVQSGEGAGQISHLSLSTEDLGKSKGRKSTQKRKYLEERQEEVSGGSSGKYQKSMVGAEHSRRERIEETIYSKTSIELGKTETVKSKYWVAHPEVDDSCQRAFKLVRRDIVSGYNKQVDYKLADFRFRNAFSNQCYNQLHSSVLDNKERDVKQELVSKVHINAQNAKGRSPLINAVMEQHMGITTMLLKAGASTETQDKNLYTPLFIAVMLNNLEIVQLLLKYKANVECRDGYGSTPLILAIKNSNVSIVKTLLDAGINPDICNCNGESALSIAITNKYYQAISLLLKYKANPNTLNPSGISPVVCAIKKGYLDIFNLLGQERKLYLNTPDQDSMMPLHHAVRRGYIAIVVELVERGVHVNAQTINGETALFMAVSEGYYDILKELLKAGANINICNRVGYSPLGIAIRDCKDKLVQLLLENGADISIRTPFGLLPSDAARFYHDKYSKNSSKYFRSQAIIQMLDIHENKEDEMNRSVMGSND